MTTNLPLTTLAGTVTRYRFTFLNKISHLVRPSCSAIPLRYKCSLCGRLTLNLVIDPGNGPLKIGHAAELHPPELRRLDLRGQVGPFREFCKGSQKPPLGIGFRIALHSELNASHEIEEAWEAETEGILQGVNEIQQEAQKISRRYAVAPNP